MIEVTFRADGAPTAIRKMKQEVPNFTVGAGTVLTVEQAEEAIEAGAEFIVSPGLDPAIVECCERKGVPVVPGCATASDCQAAYNMGLRIVKFFPGKYRGRLPRFARCIRRSQSSSLFRREALLWIIWKNSAHARLYLHAGGRSFCRRSLSAATIGQRSREEADKPLSLC